MSQYDGYGQSMPLLSDARVDQISEGGSVIDTLPSLAIDIPDEHIVHNLENRIEDAKGYWNSPDGFDLYNVRQSNMKLYAGKHIDVRALYKFQVPYVENQIYVGEQAIKAYLTASPSMPEVAPSSDAPQAKKFASDAEKIMLSHGTKKYVRMQQHVENCVENALNKRIGIMYWGFDPYAGKDGDVVPMSLNPEDVVIDKNAKQGQNPAFICRYLKMSVNEVINRWRSKRKQIMREMGIAFNPTSEKGMERQQQKLDVIVTVREVWLTWYDAAFEPHEAVVYYLDHLVLEKTRNPHYLYASPERNFLDMPAKPFIPLNFDNDGEHWIDFTSAVEQAGRIQYVLNKRGRQLMELVDKANGVLVIDTHVTGIQMSDAQDMTRDPNQTIVIDTSEVNGADGRNGIFELPAAEVPDIVFTDKQDLRAQIHAMLGTPSNFTGVASGEEDPETLGQSEIKKDQASGRQDLYVRSIDRFMDENYNFLYQMMLVWWDDKRYVRYNGGDGEFDFLVASRDTLDPDVMITVKNGSTLPFDKKRAEVVVMYLLKNEAISLLDAYKLLHMPNPQQLYDNWAKQMVDKMALARDALDDVDETKAYVAYVEIMGGKDADPPDDCTKEFILTLKKCMSRDDFLTSKHQDRKAKFLKYYEKALQSLEIRTSLDLMAKEGLQMLEPGKPLQPLPPPDMSAGQPQMGMPPPGALPPGVTPAGIQAGAPGGQMPPGMPMPGQPPQGGMPPMGAPQLPQPQSAIPAAALTRPM